MDVGDVAGDGFGGGFHEEDGVGGVDEVPVAGADELPELLALVLDLFSGGGFDGADLGYRFCSEQGFGGVDAAGGGATESAVVGGRWWGELRHCVVWMWKWRGGEGEAMEIWKERRWRSGL